jgi:hypothetical protein
MADKDNSLESGSDTGVEKRDYPGNLLRVQFPNTPLTTGYSKMVPLNFLQHDHLGSLQFLGARHLGRYE